LRNAQALARLSHSNIVGIHDVGIFGEHGWLAMDLVQGRTLRAWLDSPRGWGEVLGIMRSAGEGLVAAHRFGVLHGDFSPRHVMIGDDGHVRVKGFALTILGRGPVMHDAKTVRIEDDMSSGNPSYMAPEQLVEEHLTEASDQFAFCVTLWDALYGEPPFGGHYVLELVRNIIGGKRRPPPNDSAVPAWLQRACERGLSVDPEQRWPSMEPLLDARAEGLTLANAH
jgi:serine/threonine protein kinase